MPGLNEFPIPEYPWASGGNEGDKWVTPPPQTGYDLQTQQDHPGNDQQGVTVINQFPQNMQQNGRDNATRFEISIHEPDVQLRAALAKYAFDKFSANVQAQPAERPYYPVLDHRPGTAHETALLPPAGRREALEGTVAYSPAWAGNTTQSPGAERSKKTRFVRGSLVVAVATVATFAATSTVQSSGENQYPKSILSIDKDHIRHSWDNPELVASLVNATVKKFVGK